MPPRKKCSLKKMRATDTAWLAGWLEGEGCFNVASVNGSRMARIAAGSTDRDILDYALTITGVGNITLRKRGPTNVKPLWMWSVNAQDDVRALMVRILPWMGERRTQKIRAIMAEKGWS